MAWAGVEVDALEVSDCWGLRDAAVDSQAATERLAPLAIHLDGDDVVDVRFGHSLGLYAHKSGERPRVQVCQVSHADQSGKALRVVLEESLLLVPFDGLQVVQIAG